MHKIDADPFSGMQVVHRSESAEGLQTEQPGLQPVEKRDHMYNMQMADSNEFRPRRIFGLRPVTFWLSLALMIVTVAAIGIAAGLGVSHMKQDEQRTILSNLKFNETQGSNSTSIPANSTITLKPTTDCPDTNGQFLPTAGGNQYQKFCNSTLGGWYDEVTSAEMDTFNNCITLCANINYNLNRTDISAMYNAYGTNQYKPGYCLCASSQQKGQAQVDSDEQTDLALYVKDSSS